MIKSIENVGRGRRVSSEENRDIIDGMYQKYAKTYHRIQQLYGLTKTLSLGLEMTNVAMASTISALITDTANTLLLDAQSTYIYPSSITDGEKAEVHPEFMNIIGKRVNSRLVFTDTNNIIDPAISIVKTIGTVDNSIPTKIIENTVENCLTGASPYIARYQMDTAVRTTLTLDIKSMAKTMSINALRVVPIPAVGMISIDSIKYGAGSSVVLNGGNVLEELSDYDLDRTYQGYIHFRPVTATDLFIALSSETYVPEFGAVAIGLSKVIAELNTYASTSYIGWLATYPDGYTKISRLQILPAKYSNVVDNTRVKIYDNVTDFNAVNDNYIELCGSNTLLNIDSTTVPTPYILLELDNDSGTTPCVGKIRLEFE